MIVFITSIMNNLTTNPVKSIRDSGMDPGVGKGRGTNMSSCRSNTDFLPLSSASQLTFAIYILARSCKVFTKAIYQLFKH